MKFNAIPGRYRLGGPYGQRIHEQYVCEHRPHICSSAGEMFVSDLRQRSATMEILDGPDVPEAVRIRCHADLARMHRWLGNTRAVIKCISRNTSPVRREM